MNATTSSLALAYEAQDFIAFEQWLASLPASERKNAVQEREKWIRHRDEKMKAEAVIYEGGSMGS